MMLEWVVFLALPLLTLFLGVVFLGDDLWSAITDRNSRKKLLAEMRWVIVGLAILISFWIMDGVVLWMRLN